MEFMMVPCWNLLYEVMNLESSIYLATSTSIYPGQFMIPSLGLP